MFDLDHVLSACALCAIAAVSCASAQTIDAYVPAPNSPPTSLAVQADGKAVLVGNFLSVGGDVRTRVARFGVNGTLDPTFADPDVDGEVKTVAVQADGKLLIGGGFDHVGGQVRHALARLDADGSLDSSFADPDLDSTVWALAIQPDGKVLVGGDFTHIGATAQNYFARIDANGGFDATFADPQLCCNVVRAVALQADGRVLIGGAFTEAGGVDGHAYLARYSDSGVLDPTFPQIPESIVLLANDILVEPDGSILLGGGGAPAARRLHADGTLDTTFNAADTDGSINTIALQPNGKMLIGGNFQQVGGQPRHALAQLNADGSFDATFGDLAFAVDAAHPNGTIYGLAAQRDGKVLAIGNFSQVLGQPRQYAARVVTGHYATDELVVQGSGASLVATWYRSGDGAELALPPVLMHSSDGVNFSTAATMTRVTNGWQAAANDDVHGARFYLQATGLAVAGADDGSQSRIASPVYSNDTIFANGFDANVE
jgi:uncharacterized delta-60 repeat protein